MKNKWMRLIAAVTAVLFVGVLSLRIWFTSTGIHVWGSDIHVELTEKCYIIDESTKEIIDETTVSVNGSTSSVDPELFEGEMKVLGYQNSASGTVTSLKAIETTPNDCWKITVLENCTHREEDVNGIVKDVEHFCEYHYTYYAYPENRELFVVRIESFEEDTVLYAVCADSEETALERYERFTEQSV